MRYGNILNYNYGGIIDISGFYDNSSIVINSIVNDLDNLYYSSNVNNNKFWIQISGDPTENNINEINIGSQLLRKGNYVIKSPYNRLQDFLDNSTNIFNNRIFYYENIKNSDNSMIDNVDEQFDQDEYLWFVFRKRYIIK